MHIRGMVVTQSSGFQLDVKSVSNVLLEISAKSAKYHIRFGSSMVTGYTESNINKWTNQSPDGLLTSVY